MVFKSSRNNTKNTGKLTFNTNFIKKMNWGLIFGV